MVIDTPSDVPFLAVVILTPYLMEWKIIGHFTVKFDFEMVILVRCKLLCDGGLHAAFCRQTKAFLKPA